MENSEAISSIISLERLAEACEKHDVPITSSNHS